MKKKKRKSHLGLTLSSFSKFITYFVYVLHMCVHTQRPEADAVCLLLFLFWTGSLRERGTLFQ